MLSFLTSSASSEVARNGVLAGGRLITHLFNAMPQLHHRDPSIIGLLGAPNMIVADDVAQFSNHPGSSQNHRVIFFISLIPV